MLTVFIAKVHVLLFEVYKIHDCIYYLGLKELMTSSVIAEQLD